MAHLRLISALLGVALLLPVGSAAMPMQLQNLELREATGENPFARNVYRCLCTTEQFHAVPLPGPNWQRNAPEGSGRFFQADSASAVPPTPPPGVPTSLDLIPEIPGDDHVFIARVLDGSFLGVTAQGPVLTAQVARDTTFSFFAGRVIHTVTSPTGEGHVLFSVAEPIANSFNLDAVGGLAPLEMPAGWTYSSELLASDRTYVVQNGTAEIVTFLGGAATFQKVFLVPEPAVAWLLAAGLVPLAARRRR